MDIKRTILIVEDEGALLEVLSDKLTREGFSVVKAQDGVTGLRLAHTNLPDLILLDIVMPSMDGVTMLKKLREEEKTENIPVIIISNLSEIERITKILQAKKGVIEHIVKSHWSLEGLVDKIKKTLKVYDMLKQ
jgi:two-component system sensor histidine kinase/response regulator